MPASTVRPVWRATSAATSTIAVPVPWRRCRGQHAHLDLGQVAVLPPEEEHAGDADDLAAAAGDEAAVLLGPVPIERLGHPFFALPTRTSRLALLVDRREDGEPFVEGRAVGGVDRGHDGPVVVGALSAFGHSRAGERCLCQNIPLPAIS